MYWPFVMWAMCWVLKVSNQTPRKLKQSTWCQSQWIEKTNKFKFIQAEDDTFTSLKTAISSAPVLKFFNPEEAVTLSVDSSSKVVGAVALPNNSPMAFASKALTLSQQNYAQIKKRCRYCVWLWTLSWLFVWPAWNSSWKWPQTLGTNPAKPHPWNTPLSAKDDSQDKALRSQGQVPTRQASGPSWAYLLSFPSLLTYQKCTPM